MITRAQVDELLAFRNGEHLVTSCYLNLDRAKLPTQMLKIRTKDLLQAAHQELSRKAGTHAQRESLRADFERIEAFVMEEIGANRYRAVAIFACAGHKLWQTFGLPRVPRNLLIADVDPYVRPLTEILAGQRRYGVALVDRAHGAVYEVYLGEITQQALIDDEAPRRVKEGGLGGRDERQIERRHSQAVQRHYQRLATTLFKVFREREFDRLALGGPREALREFKHYLHPYLRARWAGDFPAASARLSAAEALRHTLEIEQQAEWDRQRELADEWARQAEAGALAVRGISDTVRALTRGEADRVLVDHTFEQPGYACFHCHYPTLEPGVCPHCQQPTQPCADVVDEVIELALERHCAVEHIHGPTALRETGQIGALLRYRA